ncbi:hypothetical protein PO124_25800 [Bacillus licheniformis]|nr:hypothetical protein [Bacillus licheniformis]
MVVFIYCMAFMFWMAAASWAVSNLCSGIKLHFRYHGKVRLFTGSVYRPRRSVDDFAIINFTAATVILSIVIFMGLTFGTLH